MNSYKLVLFMLLPIVWSSAAFSADTCSKAPELVLFSYEDIVNPDPGIIKRPTDLQWAHLNQDGLLITRTKDNTIVVLDRNLKLKNKFEVENHGTFNFSDLMPGIYTPLVGPNGQLVVASKNNHGDIYDLTGRRIATFESPSPVRSSPILYDQDTFLLRGKNNDLYFYSFDGKLKHRFKADGEGENRNIFNDYDLAPPTILSNGNIVVPGFDGFVHIVGAQGSLIKKHEMDSVTGRAHASVAPDGTVVVQFDKTVSFIDPNNGALKGEAKLGHYIKQVNNNSSGNGPAQTIVTSNEEAYFIQVDGKVKKEIDFDDYLYPPVSLINGVTFFATDKGIGKFVDKNGDVIRALGLPRNSYGMMALADKKTIILVDGANAYQIPMYGKITKIPLGDHQYSSFANTLNDGRIFVSHGKTLSLFNPGETRPIAKKEADQSGYYFHSQLADGTILLYRKNSTMTAFKLLRIRENENCLDAKKPIQDESPKEIRTAR